MRGIHCIIRCDRELRCPRMCCCWTWAAALPVLQELGLEAEAAQLADPQVGAAAAWDGADDTAGADGARMGVRDWRDVLMAWEARGAAPLGGLDAATPGEAHTPCHAMPCQDMGRPLHMHACRPVSFTWQFSMSERLKCRARSAVQCGATRYTCKGPRCVVAQEQGGACLANRSEYMHACGHMYTCTHALRRQPGRPL